MKRAIWSTKATDDLRAIRAYYADHAGAGVADRITQELVLAGRWLVEHPRSGPPVGQSGFRKWKPRRGRHILIYQIVDGGVEILRERNGATDWRNDIP